MDGLSRVLLGKADAGEAREALAEYLADWNAAGFVSLAAAHRFYRAAARLAHEVGTTPDAVIRIAIRDAREAD